MDEKKKLTFNDFPMDVPEIVKAAFSKEPWKILCEHMPEVAEFLEEHPGTPIVYDHIFNRLVKPTA